MEKSNKIKQKNIVPNEEDLNISITNEHTEQELTSMGETGKSSGIIKANNFQKFNITFIHKNKLFNKNFEQYQKEDNCSIYTDINNNRNINEETIGEVSKNFFIRYKNFQYRKYLAILDKKEKEKKAIMQIYNQKWINYQNLKFKIKNNKEKLDTIRRKNEYMKMLICKIISENK